MKKSKKQIGVDESPLYGILNAAAFNLRPEGDVTFYDSCEERDAALATMRAQAVERGLGRSSAVMGIVPVHLGVDGLPDGWLEGHTGPEDALRRWREMYDDYQGRPSDQAEMLDEVSLVAERRTVISSPVKEREGSGPER